jgi:hypothetical protein
VSEEQQNASANLEPLDFIKKLSASKKFRIAAAIVVVFIALIGLSGSGKPGKNEVEGAIYAIIGKYEMEFVDRFVELEVDITDRLQKGDDWTVHFTQTMRFKNNVTDEVVSKYQSAYPTVIAAVTYHIKNGGNRNFNDKDMVSLFGKKGTVITKGQCQITFVKSEKSWLFYPNSKKCE